MKVVMLAPASVIHTQRWVEALPARGIELLLVTQHEAVDWRAPAGVRTLQLPHRGPAGYFLNVPALRRLLRAERPDLLAVHYASGYGSTAALAGYRPWLLSVWGSDVYDFPRQGWLQGWWLRRNLRCADAVASTSEAMARQVRMLVPDIGEVAITPFGVDSVRFAPRPQAHEGIVIGTVKTLEPKYGIDVLLQAFAALVRQSVRKDLSLIIVGGGGQRGELEALAAHLGIAERVRFVGAVPHADVPAWLSRFDIFVAVSRLDSESFGVAVLEASACALPVIVSDAGGLPEVVAEGQTGLVVSREDAAALTRALVQMVDSAALRARLGAAGRARVIERYEWRHGVDAMLRCFERVSGRRL
ncbi:Glycosyltransferase [Rubrivivax sp. A210]|uniref:glycosyltransferase n=1 Tax=Rubrivivax sp. A210 TaxID=2772301 RepID=UPI00191A28A9|nr:glycosyltransferase [Rubrivivax sp. A210]CAD5372639.1 Glycosyltransferase [Rubrivivax sp. A210]